MKLTIKLARMHTRPRVSKQAQQGCRSQVPHTTANRVSVQSHLSKWEGGLFLVVSKRPGVNLTEDVQAACSLKGFSQCRGLSDGNPARVDGL